MIPFAFASLAAGAVVLIAGVTGSTMRSVAQGKPDKAHASPKLTGGTAAPSGAGGGGSHEATSTSTSTGLPAGAHKQLLAISKRRGWSVNDWMAVIGIESGGNPTAANPETGAYGIGQINPENAANPHQPRRGSTASHYRGYDGTPIEQINVMARYIASRYGTPTAALAHEHAYGWY